MVEKMTHHPAAKDIISATKETLASMNERIRKDTLKLTAVIDLAAACHVVHAIKHGNVTPARNLLGALAAGKDSLFRTNALVSFFEANGPFVYNKETETVDYDKSRAKAFKDAFNADKLGFATKLMTEPFYKLKPQSVYEGFNLMAEIKKLVKKAEKTAKKHGNDKRTDLTGLKELEALIAE